MNIEISNIAGISDGAASIRSGVNTIQASNWKGKSSFIRAIETVYGTRKPLTEGEDHGEVSLDMDDRTHEVHLDRENRTVVRRGNPVLDDEYERLVADLFAFLGEDNEIRQAVRNGENLKELLTRPLEVEDIDQRIMDLKREREAIETELERAEQKANEVVSLEQRKEELEDELAELREKEAEFEDGSASGTREELSERRAERERVTDLIDRLENTLERSREKMTEAHEEYEELDVTDTGDIESELADLKAEYERVSADEELLQSLYSANKRLIEEDRLDLLADVERGLVEDTYSCWVCGGETTEAEVESRLEKLGDKVLELRKEANEYQDRIDELQDERDEIKRKRRRKSDLENRIADLESTISEREESLSSARERLETVEEQIARLEDDVDDVGEAISDVRSDIKVTEAELEELEDRLDDARTAADRIDVLEEEHADVSEEIEELRTRKNRIQGRIRDVFDESIKTIVSRFETSFESARLTSEFELVVARDGREADLDALSEGEVELLGLVTAVAGFEAYDVGDVTSVMLLDQLGGLADDNLVTLANYLDGLTESLVLTAYPENTSVGDNRIDPTEWKIAKPAQPASA